MNSTNFSSIQQAFPSPLTSNQLIVSDNKYISATTLTGQLETREALYKCKNCNKGFSGKLEYDKHVSYHSDIENQESASSDKKYYECERCKNFFYKNTDLIQESDGLENSEENSVESVDKPLDLKDKEPNLTKAKTESSDCSDELSTSLIVPVNEQPKITKNHKKSNLSI